MKIFKLLSIFLILTNYDGKLDKKEYAATDVKFCYFVEDSSAGNLFGKAF